MKRTQAHEKVMFLLLGKVFIEWDTMIEYPRTAKTKEELIKIKKSNKIRQDFVDAGVAYLKHLEKTIGEQIFNNEFLVYETMTQNIFKKLSEGNAKDYANMMQLLDEYSKGELQFVDPNALKDGK